MISIFLHLIRAQDWMYLHSNADSFVLNNFLKFCLERSIWECVLKHERFDNECDEYATRNEVFLWNERVGKLRIFVQFVFLNMKLITTT